MVHNDLNKKKKKSSTSNQDASDRLLSEADKRRKKFSKRTQQSQAGKKLELGSHGAFKLKGSKGYKAPVARKKGERQVLKGKSKTYLIPESEKRERIIQKGMETDVPAKLHTTGTAKKTTTTVTNKQTGEVVGKGVKVTGPTSRIKDFEGTTTELKEKGFLKGAEEKSGSMVDKKVAYDSSKEAKKNRQANKVAYERPDRLVKTKQKSVRKKGEVIPSRTKKVIKTKDLVSKEYRSRDKVKPTKKIIEGPLGDTTTKTIVRGDTVIKKEKFKRTEADKNKIKRRINNRKKQSKRKANKAWGYR